MATKEIEFTYMAQPPKRYTFEQPKLKTWVESHCKGKTLNLFAGRTLLEIDEFRVDMDKEMPASWYGDAFEFVNTTILNPGGRIITLGYDSVGMSKSRGFTKEAVCLVCHNGDHNDTIGLVERKVTSEREQDRQ